MHGPVWHAIGSQACCYLMGGHVGVVVCSMAVHTGRRLSSRRAWAAVCRKACLAAIAAVAQAAAPRTSPAVDERDLQHQTHVHCAGLTCKCELLTDKCLHDLYP